MSDAIIYRSESTSASTNLALEEWLLRRRDGALPALFIYRDAPTVVLGRNQNPWLECCLPYMETQSIPLVRRISGGGTVYHDLGGLNIAFVVPRRDYDQGKYLSLIINALGSLGIRARLCERHAIWVGERKVAGSAFMLTSRAALIHACLLVDTDLDRLRNCLAAGKTGIDSKGISSVPSPVTNLATMKPGLTNRTIAEATETCFRKSFPQPRIEPLGDHAQMATDELADLVRKYTDWSWTFGRTPTFTQQLRVPTDGPGDSLPKTPQDTSTVSEAGAFIAELTVKRGIVQAIAGADKLDAALHGCRYDPSKVASALAGLASGRPH